MYNESKSIEYTVKQIVSICKPNKIILFGSRATGKFTEESDFGIVAFHCQQAIEK